MAELKPCRCGAIDYIDTGVRPDATTLSNTNTGTTLFRYECVPYWNRHFAAKVVEDINAETCKAIREHLYSKGYTDILLLDDDFILKAIGKALAEMKGADGK